MYTCTKTYGAEQGLSAVFRQHRATSHCAQLHGYALAFSFTFGATQLDERGWVVDFGGLKGLKAWLQDTFDHKLLVADDDPQIDRLVALSDGLASLTFVDAVGCEAFAKLAWSQANFMARDLTGGRARCISCTVSEHAGNSATFSEV